MPKLDKSNSTYSTVQNYFKVADIHLTYGLKEQRKRVRDWAKANLVGKSILLPGLGWEVTFTVNGIKEAVNQPHRHIHHKNEAIINIETTLPNAEFIKSEIDQTGGSNLEFHYFKTTINNDESFIVLKEIKKEGKIIFYSIVDKIRK